MRRSRELRRVCVGQSIAESQLVRPDFEILEHLHQYSVLNWYPRVIKHYRGDEGAGNAELLA